MSENQKQKFEKLQKEYGWSYDECVLAFEFVEDFSRLLARTIEENEPYATSSIDKIKAVADGSQYIRVSDLDEILE